MWLSINWYTYPLHKSIDTEEVNKQINEKLYINFLNSSNNNYIMKINKYHNILNILIIKSLTEIRSKSKPEEIFLFE